MKCLWSFGGRFKKCGAGGTRHTCSCTRINAKEAEKTLINGKIKILEKRISDIDSEIANSHAKDPALVKLESDRDTYAAKIINYNSQIAALEAPKYESWAKSFVILGNNESNVENINTDLVNHLSEFIVAYSNTGTFDKDVTANEIISFVNSLSVAEGEELNMYMKDYLDTIDPLIVNNGVLVAGMNDNLIINADSYNGEVEAARQLFGEMEESGYSISNDDKKYLEQLVQMDIQNLKYPNTELSARPAWYNPNRWVSQFIYIAHQFKGVMKTEASGFAHLGNLLETGTLLGMYYALPLTSQGFLQEQLGWSHEAIVENFKKQAEQIETSEWFQPSNFIEQEGADFSEKAAMVTLGMGVIRMGGKAANEGVLKLQKDLVGYVDNLSDVAKKGRMKLRSFGAMDLQRIDNAVAHMDDVMKNRFFERIELMEVGDYDILAQAGNLEKYSNAFEKGGKYNLVMLENLIPSDKRGAIIMKPDSDGVWYGSQPYKKLNKPDEPIDYIFKDGKIILGDSHTLMAAGSRSNTGVDVSIDYGGRIFFDKNGKITHFDNGSGHFKPSVDLEMIKKVEQQFLEQFNTNLSGKFIEFIK